MNDQSDWNPSKKRGRAGPVLQSAKMLSSVHIFLAAASISRALLQSTIACTTSQNRPMYEFPAELCCFLLWRLVLEKVETGMCVCNLEPIFFLLLADTVSSQGTFSKQFLEGWGHEKHGSTTHTPRLCSPLSKVKTRSFIMRLAK